MTPTTPSDPLLDDPTVQRVTYTSTDPEVLPLPALRFPDGKVMTEWALSEAERERIAHGERIRLWIWTFGRPLQPVGVQVTTAEEG